MIISLSCGPTLEILLSLYGGFIGAAILVVYAHYKMYKTKYYNEEYAYFSLGRKLIIYLGFLIVNLCFATLLFWIFSFILLFVFK